MIGVLAHAVRHGIYNAAADGVLTLSEVVALLGKRPLPVLPPWGTVFGASQLRRLGLRIPVETLRSLRHGRGLDNRRLKATGYAYRYTSREAVLELRAHQRLRPLLRSGGESYRYEREVEEFLRRSPSVNAPDQPPDGAADRAGGFAGGAYDELTEGELIGIISSLETEALRRLRNYEAAHRSRGRVLEALDRNLAGRGSG